MVRPDDPKRPPSRAVSFAVSAALVGLMAVIRLWAFETTVFPLTYALPLLVCVWTRDPVALWTMAVVFMGLHAVKLAWLVPAGTLSDAELWANYGATVSNVSVAAVAVHGIIRLRERLEAALRDVRTQAQELQAQGEELAQQNEELAEQTEELSQQGEELASQNEELQAQAEEIGTLNETLERREALLQTLLDTARSSGSERSALQHITTAAVDLFAGGGAAVYERRDGRLRLRALANGNERVSDDEDEVRARTDGLVDLVLARERTASLEDASLRPDLAPVVLDGHPPFKAALCAPIRFGGETFGAFAVYAAQERAWTDEEFRLVEWLADQCGRVLQTLRVQSDLREADRRKSEFLATLSHELRNPLTPLGFALELVELDGGGERHAVRVMRRQLRQLTRLVDDLLEATRLSSNKVQVRTVRTDLVPIVRHALEAVRADMAAKEQELVLTLPSEPIWVDADADRMGQVVANLLNNATRYTPAGGRITLGIEVGSAACLWVADTGIGLAPDDLERVFDMFTQVGGPGSGGLGIGLALVRGIVELHGGRVTAHSDGPGRGSEFRVELPVAAPADVEAASDGRPLPAVESCRVLVVDDNHDSAEMLAALLAAHGHRVEVAHDGASALAKAGASAVDVVILDIGLPDLNGYELAQRLRDEARTRHARLIALTGWGADGDRARAEAAGFDLHLTKPAEPHVILRALEAAPLAQD